MPAIVTKGIRARFESILNKVLSAWTVSETGGLTSSEWAISFYEDALSQLLSRDGSGLSENEFKACVTGAARELVKQGKSGSEEFNQAYERQRTEVLKRETLRFFGVARCGFYVNGLDWVPINFLGYRACLCASLPDQFDLSEFFISGHGRVYPDRPRNGLYLVAGPVAARSKNGALAHVADELTTLLGFLAFWRDYGQLWRRLGKVGPITDLRAGETITLYEADTLARVEDQVSYFTHPPTDAAWLSGNKAKALISACEAASSFDRLDPPRERYLRTAFSLYYNAVDADHPDDQITKLWKLAEFLTFSSGGTVDKIARKLSLTWAESDIIYAISSAAGHRRNIIAHHTGEGVSSTQIVEYFRYVIGIFIASSMRDDVPSLKAWKSILEVGSSGFNMEDMQSAISVLKSFSTEKSDLEE